MYEAHNFLGLQFENDEYRDFAEASSSSVDFHHYAPSDVSK